ncbi:MAG: hypothetical protein Q8N63_01210 [Nanoarchaeota archaeon]|nr:hypothetical protein [Nanoarchaeota archaeon]
MPFILFQNENLEPIVNELLNKLGIQSTFTMEGKKGRIYILQEMHLKYLDDSGIKYKILQEEKIEKYLTSRGINYLKNINH